MLPNSPNKLHVMRVFLCHSSKDKNVVRRIAKRLRPYLVNTWFDEQELAIGDTLHAAIGSALDSSDCLLACISTNSLESRWVQRELSAFFAREVDSVKPLVLPLLLDDCQPTAFLRDRLQARLSTGESYAIAAVLRGLNRSRAVVLARASPGDPFRISREDVNTAAESYSGQVGPITGPLIVPDIDGLLGAVEWILNNSAKALRANGNEAEADRWTHYADWHQGIIDNLALAIEGVANECARHHRRSGVGPSVGVMSLAPAIDTVWKHLIRLVLLDLPSFISGCSEVPLPNEHAAWSPWFRWADERLKDRIGRGVILTAMGLADSCELISLDLVGPGNPPDPVGRALVQRDRVIPRANSSQSGLMSASHRLRLAWSLTKHI